MLPTFQFRFLLSTISFISTCASEGVIAYYWSQFDIPVEDLEIVPEFSEERVLKALEKGISEQRSTGSNKNIKISEITASCKCHQRGVGVLHKGHNRVNSVFGTAVPRL